MPIDDILAHLRSTSLGDADLPHAVWACIGLFFRQRGYYTLGDLTLASYAQWEEWYEGNQLPILVVDYLAQVRLPGGKALYDNSVARAGAFSTSDKVPHQRATGKQKFTKPTEVKPFEHVLFDALPACWKKKNKLYTLVLSYAVFSLHHNQFEAARSVLTRYLAKDAGLNPAAAPRSLVNDWLFGSCHVYQICLPPFSTISRFLYLPGSDVLLHNDPITRLRCWDYL